MMGRNPMGFWRCSKYAEANFAVDVLTAHLLPASVKPRLPANMFHYVNVAY